MTTPHLFAVGEPGRAADLNTLSLSLTEFISGVAGNVDGITVGTTSLTNNGGVASANVTGLSTPGTTWGVITGPNSSQPGVGGVTETSANNVTGTSFTLNMFRSDTTGTTGIWWIHIGYH